MFSILIMPFLCMFLPLSVMIVFVGHDYENLADTDYFTIEIRSEV